jgi:UDP-3-O-[3-hydroxymyristoyl] glucosamine N-acyltransferase
MSWTRSLSALDILASSGMAAVDAGGGVGVGVAVGVKVGVGVGVGVDVGVAVGVKVGAGVAVGVDVGVAVGVKVGAGVAVGVDVGLTDRPQLRVRKPIRGRENARRRLVRFRPIVKHPFKMRFKQRWMIPHRDTRASRDTICLFQ